MEITGIICEYDPLHLGHKKQIDLVRAERPDCGIVCLMSGNYVQRGKPAIIDKSLRAKAAVLSGADLVLELPVTASLSSAEGFAREGTRILGDFCHYLSFGAETADSTLLMETAEALLSPAFAEKLTQFLDTGCSFPAARQSALTELGGSGGLLSQPNDILAVEYCKAIISQNLQITPSPIPREGGYHDTSPNPVNPSATAVRHLMLTGQEWLTYIPQSAHSVFQDAAIHALSAGERAVLARLRTMRDEEFEALPYGSEGLWRKLMRNARQCDSLEDILAATKSKRYTRSRLDRMVMCAFLGITREDLTAPAPYTRVLAFNDRGREILKLARMRSHFPNCGQPLDGVYQQLENRCGDLYGLFSIKSPEKPGAERIRRVYYYQEDKNNDGQ